MVFLSRKRVEKMYQDFEKFLQENQFEYEKYEHEKIYTNEDAVAMKERLGFTGTETNTLFLKGKNGKYYIFFKYPDKRADFKYIKELAGVKVSVASAEEMVEVANQTPGAVSPLGYDAEVPLVIDKGLFEEEKLVFAPGRPDNTLVIYGKDLPKMLELLGNEVLVYEK